jgi:hypothetical protein
VSIANDKLRRGTDDVTSNCHVVSLLPNEKEEFQTMASELRPTVRQAKSVTLNERKEERTVSSLYREKRIQNS